MKSIIVAGSFDPITYGHMWLIEQALEVADHVIVVVGNHPSKKYMFTGEERVKMVWNDVRRRFPIAISNQVAVHELGNELLVNYAAANGTDYIMRGIRNATDFAYETEIVAVNKHIQPNVRTLFVVPPKELTEVSSSTVKSLIGYPGWEDILREYVSSSTIAAINRKRDEDGEVKVKITPQHSDVEDEVPFILRQWSDGPKVVFDFKDEIPPSPGYAILQLDDEEAWEESPILSYLEIPAAATIYTNGSIVQQLKIRKRFPNHNHNVIKFDGKMY